MADDRFPSSKSRGAEGRRHSRREAGGLTVSCYRAEEGRSIRGRKNFGIAVLDISGGGARLGVTEPLAGGTVLTVEIRETATGELFHARATVRWCDTRTVGGVARHTIGLKWDEIFTAVGKRDRFFYGKDGQPAKAVDLRDRLPSERMPAPVESPKVQEPAGDVRFQVDDYEVTVTRSGLFASRRNLARTVSSLGGDGAQVECSEKLGVGTKVRFALHLHKFADTFEAPAEVVWSKEATAGGHLTGLVFGKVNPAQRRLLEYMMSWFTSYQAKYRQSHR